MTAGQLAALIAAISFAVLAGVGVVVLIKLARLTAAATRLMTGYAARADLLLDHAQAAVDQTCEQLARTDSITASMDQVTANMAELSDHVSALTALARAISGAASSSVSGMSALAYGVRRAVIVRRSAHAPVLADTVLADTVQADTVPADTLPRPPARSLAARAESAGRR